MKEKTFGEHVLGIQGYIVTLFVFLAYTQILIVQRFGTTNSWIINTYPGFLGLLVISVGATVGLMGFLSLLYNKTYLIITAFALISIFHFTMAVVNAVAFHGLGSQMIYYFFIAALTGLRFGYHVNEYKSTVQ